MFGLGFRLFVGVAAAGLFVFSSILVVFAQERSIADGVYTSEQAARGKREYTQQCAACHASNLMGGEMAPSLVGDGFVGGWSGETLWTLADYTNVTMPQDAPGRLSAQSLNDVLAFILASNDYPAGTDELALDLNAEGDPILIN